MLWTAARNDNLDQARADPAERRFATARPSVALSRPKAENLVSNYLAPNGVVLDTYEATSAQADGAPHN